MLRRNASAYRLAIKMDPTRRDLFVEGPRDRAFLTQVIGQFGTNARILDAANHIDDPDETDGAKGRLVRLAGAIGNVPQTRFFVDKDWDSLLGIPRPAHVHATDFRDLEGYVLDPDVVQKAISVGLADEKRKAPTILKDVVRVCLESAAIRVHALRLGLRLPFKSVDLTRHFIRNGPLQLDRRKYLTTACQNADATERAKVGSVDAFLAGADGVRTEIEKLNWREVVHGKDAFAVITHIFRKDHVEGTTHAALWCSFERSDARQYQVLSQVIVAWLV